MQVSLFVARAGASCDLQERPEMLPLTASQPLFRGYLIGVSDQ
jgi:hypothetical protein